MNSMRLLLGLTLAVLLLAYASSLPFYDYYSGLPELTERQHEHWVAADLQFSSSIGYIIFVTLFWLGYEIDRKYPWLRKRL